MHFSNGRFSNKETGFSGPFVVWSLLGAPGEKKRENQMYLQSTLSGEKKVHALFFSRKKNTFGGDKGWQILRVKSARIEGG